MNGHLILWPLDQVLWHFWEGWSIWPCTTAAHTQLKHEIWKHLYHRLVHPPPASVYSLYGRPPPFIYAVCFHFYYILVQQVPGARPVCHFFLKNATIYFFLYQFPNNWLKYSYRTIKDIVKKHPHFGHISFVSYLCGSFWFRMNYHRINPPDE